MNPEITVRRVGAAKQSPFTIVIVANPALEAPWQSGSFVADPIMQNLAGFAGSVQYIDDALFGNLPNQQENLLGDPVVAPQVRLVTLVDQQLQPNNQNALLAQDGMSNILVARRASFVPFLAKYGLQADVAYAVSGSLTHTRASAWFTSDDDNQPGVAFQLNGSTLFHRHYNTIPGTVALPVTSTSMTAVHEFQHAISSYTNGKIVDLYVDSAAALNCQVGRPIPAVFSTYAGTTYATDPARDSLGYPPGWQSYHCELIDPTRPALMDDYWLAAGAPELSQNDGITRQFVSDRIRAKLQR